MGTAETGLLGHDLAHDTDQPQHLRRATAAVDADDVDIQFCQPRGDIFRPAAQERAIVAREGHLGDDWHIGRDEARGSNGRLHLFDIGHRLDDQQVDSARFGHDQGFDLLDKGRRALLRLRRGPTEPGARPDGPMEPARSTSRNDPAMTRRATETAAWLISVTWSSSM